MADTKEAEAEITLETYDKHHVKVPKSIATRSAIINMMIEGKRPRPPLVGRNFCALACAVSDGPACADTGDTNEVVPLADKSCTLSIINRVVDYLKKHAEFEATNADDEVRFSPSLSFPFPSAGTAGTAAAPGPGDWPAMLLLYLPAWWGCVRLPAVWIVPGREQSRFSALAARRFLLFVLHGASAPMRWTLKLVPGCR